MRLSWDNLVRSVDKIAPNGSPRRKLLFILAFILFVEGLSVIVLFSKAGLIAGLISLFLGTLLILLMRPSMRGREAKEVLADSPAFVKVTPGIRFVDAVTDFVGNRYVFSAMGILLMALVIWWNLYYSDRSDLGDLDTLTILFGGILAVYPFVPSGYKLEAVFSLLFLGFVVLLLVVPQVFASFGSGAGTSVGNWYVHYMLAAPFAGILDLLGIPASSSGDMVTIQFQDGTIQVLGISAYCAGLYSFSIFLSAFMSYVLVFESLMRRTLAVVLCIGLVIAYLGNLFRMVIIGVVGYYRGIEALLWAHENVGWMIFLAWSAVFWYFLLGYTAKESRKRMKSVNSESG